MDPFGGTPRCPRCAKLVYAAEQVIGPGRKMYHKTCLTCTTCSKRLDSYTLVEHDSEPYCKQCHLRNFSTHDLRHANLPQSTPPNSPPRRLSLKPPGSPGKLDFSNLPSPGKRDLAEDTPIEPSPLPLSFPPVNVPEAIPETEEVEVAEPDEGARTSSPSPSPALPPRPQRARPPSLPPKISIYSRQATLPVYSPNRVVSTPEKGTRDDSDLAVGSNGTADEDEGNATPKSSVPLATSISEPPQTAPPTAMGFAKRIVPMSTGGSVVPIPGAFSPTKRMTQTFTGTPTSSPSPALSPNYTGQSGYGGSPRRLAPNFTGGSWGGNAGRVECPRCAKAVYHAEGVNAVGKRWHKACLRCTECAASLDSTRLTDRDGEPYCKSCYGKLYGPAGSGYALLGKVG